MMCECISSNCFTLGVLQEKAAMIPVHISTMVAMEEQRVAVTVGLVRWEV